IGIPILFPKNNRAILRYYEFCKVLQFFPDWSCVVLCVILPCSRYVSGMEKQSACLIWWKRNLPGLRHREFPHTKWLTHYQSIVQKVLVLIFGYTTGPLMREGNRCKYPNNGRKDFYGCDWLPVLLFFFREKIPVQQSTRRFRAVLFRYQKN